MVAARESMVAGMRLLVLVLSMVHGIVAAVLWDHQRHLGALTALIFAGIWMYVFIASGSPASDPKGKEER